MADGIEHEVDDMLAAAIDFVGPGKVALEGGTQRMRVGEVEKRERPHRDVEMVGIDPRPEQAPPLAPLENGPDSPDQGRVEVGNVAHRGEVPSAVQVLVREEPDEVLVVPDMVEREDHEPPDRLHGIVDGRVEFVVAGAEALVALLENLDIEALLRSEVIEENLFAHPRARNDVLDSRALQTTPGEFPTRGFQEALTGLLRISLRGGLSRTSLLHVLPSSGDCRERPIRAGRRHGVVPSCTIAHGTLNMSQPVG
jgi:hypothetical protein